MSDHENSGNNSSGPAKSGSANRRKRSYRHFGPSGSAGDATTAGDPNRSGPVERKRDGTADHSSQTGKKETQNRSESGQRRSAAGNRSGSGSRSRQNRSTQSRTQTGGPAENAAIKNSAPEQAQQAVSQKKKKSSPSARPSRTKMQENRANRSVNWEKKIKVEETYEEIKNEIERIEKEIWLEIAGLHTIRLDY